MISLDLRFEQFSILQRINSAKTSVPEWCKNSALKFINDLLLKTMCFYSVHLSRKNRRGKKKRCVVENHL